MVAKTETPVRITDMSQQAAVPIPSITSMVERSAAEIAAFSDQFLGPGLPMNSFRGQYPPRRMDYPASVNIRISPEKPFVMLRNLSAWDPVRYCIERRKNGVKSRKWAIVPEDPDQLKTGRFDKAIQDLTQYWKRPDPQNRQTFDLWVSNLLEASFTWDAATLMRWPTRDGKGIACHRLIDGSTITPKVDSLGNIPLPPAPAYQQIIKGIPLTEYDADRMLYLVRNPRPDSPYGMSEVEWLLICVNIALRRDTSDLLHWTSGNIPYGFGELPEDWTPEQIAEWGQVWDDMLAGDQIERSKIKWGPHGMNFKEFQQRNKGSEDWKFYEWSARRTCAIFGVAPTAYAGQTNRATAETAEEAQGELAEEPLCQWFEQIITTEIQTVQGQSELCFKFVTEKQHNELETAQANKERIFSGQISLDSVLNDAGEEEIGIPPFVLVPGQGIVYLKGQNPEYIKKYEKFFQQQVEQESAAAEAKAKALAALKPAVNADQNEQAPGDNKKIAPTKGEVDGNVAKGDVLGHEFRGNQHTEGGAIVNDQSEAQQLREEMQGHSIQMKTHASEAARLEREQATASDRGEHARAARLQTQAEEHHAAHREASFAHDHTATRLRALGSAAKMVESKPLTLATRETLADLRKWRRRARVDFTSGEVQKSFESSLIPEGVQKSVAACMGVAQDLDGIEAAFTAAMRSVLGRDLSDVG
jgi:hypothetical protein